MLEELIANLINVKRDFAKNYSGSAHIQEVIPSRPTKEFQIDENHLKNYTNLQRKTPSTLIHLKRIF